MIVITAQQMQKNLRYGEIVDALQDTYGEPSMAAHRHLHYMPELEREEGVCMATMPAWGKGHDIGTKVFTYFPNNNSRGVPTVQAVVLLFDGETGTPKALLDGTELTLWRTASMSALASRLLSRESSSKLLLCGAGALAPHAALAHADVRPIREIKVWARRLEAAESTAEIIRKRRPDLQVAVTEDLATTVQEVDIISCQTSAKEPFLKGTWIRPGTHVDLAGSHSPSSRECDDATILKSLVFMDVMENAKTEAGDVIIPIQNGTITETHILGDLADLCSRRVAGRSQDSQITTYKSTGSALADLSAAEHVFNKVSKLI